MPVKRTKDPQKAEHRLCPECGAPMVVVDQCTENGALFTWFGCTRDDCAGQWLEKEYLTRHTSA